MEQDAEQTDPIGRVRKADHMYNSSPDNKNSQLQNPWASHAMWLYDLGLSVVPLKYQSKQCARSTWADLQSVRMTADEVAYWARKQPTGLMEVVPHNVGVITGKLSGVVVVEADTPEAVEYIKATLPATPVMVQSRPGRCHFYYRNPEGVEVRNWQGVTVNGGVAGIDMRAEGGLVAGPGSVHASGAVYTPLGDWSKWAEMPTYDPSWLVVDPKKKPAAPSVVDDDHDDQGERTGGVLQDPDSFDLTAKQNQARAYLFTQPGTIEHSNNENRCLAIAIALVHGYALSPEEALPVFVEWGLKASQKRLDGSWYPWEEAELLHKLESAAKKDPGKPVGYELKPDEDQLRDQLAAVLGVEFAEEGTALVVEDQPASVVCPEPAPAKFDLLDAIAAAPVPAAVDVVTPPKKQPLFILTGKDFDTLADAETDVWLIQDIMMADTLTILSGKPYCGKTYMVRKMIACLLEGKKFFNYQTTQTPVLYINSDRNRVRKTRDEIKKFLSVDGEGCYQDLFFAVNMDLMPDKFQTELLENLTKLVIQMLIDNGLWRGRLLVIVDTFRSAFLCGAEQGAESDSTAMVTVLKPIKGLVKKLSASYLIVHHDPKHSSGAAGSGAIPGTTDQVWGYARDRGSDVAEFSIMTRDDDFPPFKVVRTADGMLEVGDDTAIKVMKAVAKQDTDEVMIAGICEVMPFGIENALTKIQAAALPIFAGMSEDTVVRRLKLCERGGHSPRLERIGDGKSKLSPYKWFRVA